MLGTINPVAEIARRAHEVGAIVVVDASQAVPQLPVDVQSPAAPTCVAFTGHKVRRPDRHRRALGPARGARRSCRRSSVAAR